MPSQFTEKTNTTLVVTCAACGKEVSTAHGDSVGLQFRAANGFSQIAAVCSACYQKGWRPTGYTGF